MEGLLEELDDEANVIYLDEVKIGENTRNSTAIEPSDNIKMGEDTGIPAIVKDIPDTID